MKVKKKNKINMEEITKKTKNQLIISSLIFIIILSSVSVLYLMINKTAKNTIELRQELVVASKEDIVTLKRAIRNYEKHSDVVDEIIVDRNKAFAFIGDIETLATNSGLSSTVENVELLDVLKSGKTISANSKDSNDQDRLHGQLKIILSVDGEWDEIISFLIKLENIPPQAVIDSIRLSTVFDQATKKTGWSASFNILATTD